MLAERLLNAWYQGAGWLRLLRPLSWLFERIVRRRRERAERMPRWQPPVPVIVVGNITLGGTGKSPMVAALAAHFRERGYNPGIISRGYGGRAPAYPFPVTAETDPELAGDEPVMLAYLTGCPVMVDPNRVQAAQALLERHRCDLILSDDGLQHYRLRRDVEVVLVDGGRGLGNGWCLPAGPLREPAQRLEQVDAVVCTGERKRPLPVSCWEMRLAPLEIIHLASGQRTRPEDWRGRRVHGVAGIGNPDRFFATLADLGLQVVKHAFADHQRYNPRDFEFDEELPILMTEKDAVKCRSFVDPRMYALRVRAQLDASFFERIERKLKRTLDASETHG